MSEAEHWKAIDLFALANHVRGNHRDGNVNTRGCSECFALVGRGNAGARAGALPRNQRWGMKDYYSRLAIADELLAQPEPEPPKPTFKWTDLEP